VNDLGGTTGTLCPAQEWVTWATRFRRGANALTPIDIKQGDVYRSEFVMTNSTCSGAEGW